MIGKCGVCNKQINSCTCSPISRPCFFHPYMYCKNGECTDLEVEFYAQPDINWRTVECDFQRGKKYETWEHIDGNLSF